ncbi:hypothetical protein Goarm_020607 [Gossypium armourianum]|uniref:Uncharacterized protein n=1 Tax=Gossypium armourianum TaxID=34283 RepID=A0A7J9IQM9_9ROSI|nr:hypothetical protein [Gossypium armourianum]
MMIFIQLKIWEVHGEIIQGKGQQLFTIVLQQSKNLKGTFRKF